jgi:hypothetical protein
MFDEFKAILIKLFNPHNELEEEEAADKVYRYFKGFSRRVELKQNYNTNP